MNWYMKIETVGAPEIVALIDAFGLKVHAAAAGAVLDEANLELEMTQELVPVATGELKASGRVEASQEAGTIGANIIYGGPAGSGRNAVDVDYALAVHEDLAAHHPHGQAKYVEAVVQEEEASGRTAERMVGFVVGRLALSGAFVNRPGFYIRSALTGRFGGSRAGFNPSGVQG